MLVETLITKAAERAGGQKKLGEMIGVSETVISAWKAGKRKIKPADITAIGHIAGMNAMTLLALATLLESKGTKKEKVLQDALGESIKQLEGTLLGGLSKNNHKIQCGFMFTLRNLGNALMCKCLQIPVYQRRKVGFA